MKESYVNICGIPTHVITCGAWIEGSKENIPEVAICITGNPGLPGYYIEFCNALHERLKKRIPIWIIGHLGHDDPPPNSLRQVPQLEGNEELFDLDAQVIHKLVFIDRFVPEKTKIHLIGHSIGAWMVLQMLNSDRLRKRIRKCYLLFPTIERMVDTSNGWMFTKVALPLFWLFGFLIKLFDRLPETIRIHMVQIYFWFTSIPYYLIGTTLKYLQPAVLQKIVFLAEDEMERVRELDYEIISKYIHLLKFYYGTTDKWVPVQYYEELKENFPEIDAELDTKKIDHSFVLKHSGQMADIVAGFIATNSHLEDL